MRAKLQTTFAGTAALVLFQIFCVWNVAAEEIVFAVRQPRGPHWYENFGHGINDPDKPIYGARGRLCKLNVETGKLTLLIDDAEGGVRDPQVHYSGRKVLFSYRRGGTAFHHLYEINIDGTGLRQLTRDSFDDIEPSYLPDGGIVFCSSRCKRFVPCWYVQVATLYRCDANGMNIQPLSSNIEQDNTPWVLPDGRILYTRWEYVDRSREHFHHLWVMNPDGTGQMTYFGNMHAGDVFLDAKPGGRPGEIVMVNSPNHGRQEHEGSIALVDSARGPDTAGAQTIIARGNSYRDPYALDADSFLVAQRERLLLLRRDGEMRELYRLSGKLAEQGAWIHEPRPVRARGKEPVIATKTADEPHGRILVADLYSGRNMDGIARGTIRRLLVLENLPKPVNFGGSMEPISYGGSYTLNRVLGVVPVESDGSVNAIVPALRSLQLVALDEDDLSVKRMLSFFTVMPGETAACAGCHEHRASAPSQATRHCDVTPPSAGSRASSVLAAQRAPRPIEPIPGTSEVLDYPRDIQPIWDRHCLKCHDVDGYVKNGRVLLAGDQGPIFTHSYFTLSARLQIADGRDLARGNYAPRTIGSSASPLMDKLGPSHHGVNLSSHELRTIKLWIDASATFPGTYAALGSGMIGSYASLQYGTKPRVDYLQRPAFREAKAVIERRCASCHDGKTKLPISPVDDLDLRPHHLAYAGGAPRMWEPPWVKPYGDDSIQYSNSAPIQQSQGQLRIGTVDWMKRYADPRLQFSRHVLYNLSRPEKSLLLLAPLSHDGGGFDLCGAVFTDLKDADAQTLLAAIRETKAELESITRFNMPNFRPEPEYLREMKAYGVLQRDWKVGDPVDVYELDQRYWRTLVLESLHR